MTNDRPLAFWNDAQITENIAGFPICETCNEPWCEHIEDFIRHNADAEFWWVPVPTNERLIMVPIVPTAALWVTMRLEYKEKVAAYAVSFDDEAFVHFLGFVHRGEGRYVLRSMMIDWFWGHVDTSTFKCDAFSHGYKREMMWQHAMQKRSTSFPQLFSLWRTKMCVACHNSTAGDDWDDLIPDVDPKVSPWNK